MVKLRASAKLLALGAALSLGCGSSSSGTGGTGGATGGAGALDGGGTGGVTAGPDAGPDAGATGGGEAGTDAEPPGGVGGSVGTSVSLDDFTRTLAMAYCQRVFQCCTVMNLDPESCQNEIVGQRELVVEGLRPFVASGKLTYRPDQAAACINGLLAASCTVVKAGSPTINTVTLCDEAFQSATAPGGDCTDDVQCIDGWCSPDTMKCVARKADGGTCDDDGDCLSDNCSPTTGTCVPRMVEGLCPV